MTQNKSNISKATSVAVGQNFHSVLTLLMCNRTFVCTLIA